VTRDEACRKIAWQVARAFGVSIKRVRVEWDQPHSKPKVRVSDLNVAIMPEAERRAILAGVLADGALQPFLDALREPLSDDELRNRLKALCDRQNSN